MESASEDEIADWLAAAGLRGASEVDLLAEFCERCVVAGLPIGRAIVILDTLHPVYEGRGFRWREDGIEESALLEFERQRESYTTDSWRKSPFYHLIEKGGGEIRLQLRLGETGGFEAVESLRAEGQTDYLAIVYMFAPDGVIGEIDNFAARWSTSHPDGFTQQHLQSLRRFTPILGLAIKSASLARVTEAIVEAYLGRDAGRRVLGGRITRGEVEKINAVLWYSDLKGFTTLSETMASDELIPFLNDHADVVISAIQEAGGDVLKLIGDGVLAIFNGEDLQLACRTALHAEAGMRARLAELHTLRHANGTSCADVYLGLHVGDVFYGNVGSRDRLDFTVVGQAVNEVARIASMCRSVDRDLLVSSDFRDLLAEDVQADLVSVGRFALRGVGQARHLYTVDPALERTRFAFSQS